MAFFIYIKNLLLDYLFPREGRIALLYSLSAEDLVSALPPATPTGVAGVFSLFAYHSPLVHDAVWEVKYKGSKELARKFAPLLYDTLVAELEERHTLNRARPILLVPMPVSDERRLERGWNQAEILAEALLTQDSAARFTYAPKALRKVRHTESQTHTSGKEERLRNLQHSMQANPSLVAGESIVLIDDVYTTGATYAEAKRALRDAGTRDVVCLTLAH